MGIPSEATEALLEIRKHLNRSLIAAYLHGSAVAGGLRPQRCLWGSSKRLKPREPKKSGARVLQ